MILDVSDLTVISVDGLDAMLTSTAFGFQRV